MTKDLELCENVTVHELRHLRPLALISLLKVQTLRSLLLSWWIFRAF